MTVHRDPNYCSKCYGAAQKAGRPVRMTDVCDYPICLLCESRIRNGLVHYIPSNGTEGMIFQERCEQCRHLSADPRGFDTCAWGILDQMLDSAWEEHDSAKVWYDPEVLDPETCPATCKRFTGKGDADGPSRDPPPKDCTGQMFLDELLEVPVERVPERVGVMA